MTTTPLTLAAPKVSVIIPMYKVEKYLEKCLDSVVHQTLEDIEIICIDDGSPDRSGEIAEEYAQIYPNVSVIHQENRGLSGARNAGMDAARGKYVYFLDSDDYLELEAMEALYSKAEELQVEILSFDARVVFESEEAKKQRPEGFEFSYRRSQKYGGGDLYRPGAVSRNSQPSGRLALWRVLRLPLKRISGKA